MSNRAYHYTESGLDNVFLRGGYEYQKTEGGRTVAFHDIEGLHRAIGLALVNTHQRLSGRELRFLRTEMLLSQAGLADYLGVRELTIGRWEKGQSEIPLSADALVRMLFLESVGHRKGRVRDLLERMADLEDEIDRRQLTLEKSNGEWVSQAA